MLTDMTLYVDRSDAGRQLAGQLEYLRGQDVVVLGLPRGGVPVGFEVAKALGAPLDVLVVRKLSVPFQPDVTFGAIGEDTPRVVNDPIMRAARLSGNDVDAIEREQRAELYRQVERFRGGRRRAPLTGRIAVIVDDGIATGTTMRAACQVARAQGARKVVLAAPLGPAYRNFPETSDDDVIRLLAQAEVGYRATAAGLHTCDPLLCKHKVRIPAGPVTLAARLTIPKRARLLDVGAWVVRQPDTAALR